jgi:trk system potassium uptake protein TrkH
MIVRNRDRFLLFSYFLAFIAVGSLLLWLPFAWQGPHRLTYLDALFTATSAVCVTGLVTVDTAMYSMFGRLVILLLIQFGGLGIITFMTIFLANPRGRISFASRKLIGDYYVGSVEINPRRIIRGVLVSTVVIEVLGAACMAPALWRAVGSRAPFYALFHAVSAFCNAGFSLFSDNLERFVTNPAINLAVMALVVLGGLGFVVIEDLTERALGRRRHLSLHTRLVLPTSAVLIVLGAAVFLAFEATRAYAGLRPAQKLMAAVFQSVTPRTAGFDTVSQRTLSAPSSVFSIFLMYIGASPASTGGGIKTTTFFLVLVMMLRGSGERERIRVFGRTLTTASVNRGMMYALRAFAILAMSILVLSISELLGRPPGEHQFLDVVFESFSAFGTVGLSRGLTPYLTIPGKAIIILTMLAGRVGMAALAITPPRRLAAKPVEVPEEEVLVG